MVAHLRYFRVLHQQREILIWRGLRAAAQEGYLHVLSKTRDNKEPYVIGDLEKLQVKIQNAEGEVTSKSTPAPTPAPMPIVTAPAPSDTGELSKVDTGGTDDGASMDVDSKGSEEDVKSAVTEAGKSGALDVSVATTSVTGDVEMTEAKREVKTEAQ